MKIEPTEKRTNEIFVYLLRRANGKFRVQLKYLDNITQGEKLTATAYIIRKKDWAGGSFLPFSWIGMKRIFKVVWEIDKTTSQEEAEQILQKASMEQWKNFATEISAMKVASPTHTSSLSTLATKLLSLFLTEEQQTALLGDLEEEFEERLSQGSRQAACWWYRRQAARTICLVVWARIRKLAVRFNPVR